MLPTGHEISNELAVAWNVNVGAPATTWTVPFTFKLAVLQVSPGSNEGS